MKTYGTARLHDGRWIIQAEPHVSLRMKRVFNKIDKSQVGYVIISNTPENCRDLEWFITRYPLEVTPAETLAEQACRYRETQSLVNRLLESVGSSLEFPMALPPRDYQAQAAEIALNTGGLLVADEVGLGKTVTAIAMLVQKNTRPALVVTLAQLMPRQWRDFLKRFAPHLRTHILKRRQPYDIRQPDGQFPDVVIMNYHKLSGWSETLAPIVKCVIWDEAQELRRADSSKYSSAKFIAASTSIRIGLSATPIYNNGDEMFNVMDCIMPGALGTKDEFSREWTVGDGVVGNPKAFGEYLRDQGWMVLRTREQVGRQLPACTVMIQPIESDTDYLAHLDCTDLARTILSASEEYRGQKMQASSEFDMRMRQATGIAKAPYIAAFARMFLERDEPVMIYCWHREVYGILLKQLEAFKPVMYTGSESVNQKEESKRKFLAGESNCMLISLRAGQGLDGLQDRCKTVLFGELDWSPGVHEQDIGRVFRDGQKYPVFAYYLLSDSGSDPVISDTLGLKTQQIDGIRKPKQELIEKLQVDPDHIKKLARDYLNRKGVTVSSVPIKPKTVPQPGVLF